MTESQSHTQFMQVSDDLPVPIASLWARLDQRSDTFLDQVFELFETTFAVTLAYGLTRCRSASEIERSTLAGIGSALVNPTLGARLDANIELEKILPGSTGWDLDSPAPWSRDFIAAVRETVPKRPKIRHVLESMVPPRNDRAHFRLDRWRRRQLEGQLDPLFTHLFLANKLLVTGHLLLVTGVEKTGGGSFGYTAISLRGRWPATFDKGALREHTEAAALEKHRVYLLTKGDDLLPLHPLVVAQ